MGEVTGKGSITPSAHPSAVRVTDRSFHSERQGLATSVLGNENISAEVAVYSPVSLEFGTTAQKPADLDANGESMIGARSLVTNGDLLAWL